MTVKELIKALQELGEEVENYEVMALVALDGNRLLKRVFITTRWANPRIVLSDTERL